MHIKIILKNKLFLKLFILGTLKKKVVKEKRKEINRENS